MELSNNIIETLKNHNYTIENTKIMKGCVEKEVLKVTPENKNFSAVIYINPEIEKFSEEDLIDYILKAMKKEAPSIDEEMFSWENAKNNIFLCLRPCTPDNENKVSKSFLDLELYTRIFIEDKNSQLSIEINKELLKHFNVSEAALFNMAEENTYLNSKIISFEEMLGIPKNTIAPLGILIIENNYKIFGAGAMNSIRKMKEVYEKFLENFYILPSSIHELLVVPESFCEPDDLRDMVLSVNSICVEENEFLSNSIYYFNNDTEEIILVKELNNNEKNENQN